MNAILHEYREDTGWITLNNAVKYRKKNGIVYVDYATQGTTGTYGTLPEGYRPQNGMNNCLFNESGANIRVYILSSGDVGEVSTTSVGHYIWTYPAD